MGKVSLDIAHQSWRREYRQYRYLQHFSQDELDQRLRDIYLNMIMLEPNAKFGITPTHPEHHWIGLFTHISEEIMMRYGPAGHRPQIGRALKEDPFPDYLNDLGRKAAGIIESKCFQADNVLIKYGRLDHMEALYERGAMRIQSASYYDDDAHNQAVGDNELMLSCDLYLNQEQLLSFGIDATRESFISGRMPLKVTQQLDRDYWLYCTTESLASRMFVDFDATACVVIKDKSKFIRRMLYQSPSKFGGIIPKHGRVHYIDPLLSPFDKKLHKLPISHSKHFRYTYQDEYRFVWWPTEIVRSLGHIDIEIGSLEDISELVVL